MSAATVKELQKQKRSVQKKKGNGTLDLRVAPDICGRIVQAKQKAQLLQAQFKAADAEFSALVAEALASIDAPMDNSILCTVCGRARPLNQQLCRCQQGK